MYTRGRVISSHWAAIGFRSTSGDFYRVLRTQFAMHLIHIIILRRQRVLFVSFGVVGTATDNVYRCGKPLRFIVPIYG